MSINEEEKNPRKNHAKIGHSNMKHVEEDGEDVEMVRVKENLKHFSSNTIKTRHPHH